MLRMRDQASSYLYGLNAALRADRFAPRSSSSPSPPLLRPERPDVLPVAVLVSGAVSNDVQVFDRLVGHLQTVLMLKVGTGASCPLDHVRAATVCLPDGLEADLLERHGIPWSIRKSIELV